MLHKAVTPRSSQKNLKCEGGPQFLHPGLPAREPSFYFSTLSKNIQKESSLFTVSNLCFTPCLFSNHSFHLSRINSILQKFVTSSRFISFAFWLAFDACFTQAPFNVSISLVRSFAMQLQPHHHELLSRFHLNIRFEGSQIVWMITSEVRLAALFTSSVGLHVIEDMETINFKL